MLEIHRQDEIFRMVSDVNEALNVIEVPGLIVILIEFNLINLRVE